jgi:UDP-GlcNAc:undecaprenyl-phosphate GlcNAc-1-phosphate transferase
MLIKYLIVFLDGLLLSVILINLLMKIPFFRKYLSSQGIPLIGGLGIGSAFIFSSLLGFSMFGNFSKAVTGIVVSSTFILIFGLIDDSRELSVLTKFLSQIIAATLLILFGVRTHIVFLNEPFNIIVTFIWIIGIANAFNHLDVMDGLAGNAAFISSLAFCVIAFMNQDIKMVILTLGLAGSILGFLAYNLPPAKIYMGNSGSHFLGILLGGIALVISYAPLERKIALLSPIVILGLPILDTLFLIFIRIRKGKLPFNKSNDHIALRLLKLRYPKRRALSTMIMMCLFFLLCGLLLCVVPNTTGILLIMLAITVSVMIIHRISKVSVDG